MEKIVLVNKPRRIAGLTTYTSKQYLDKYLKTKKGRQGFEIYEGPPEFLSKDSLIFLFEKGNGLRAIAKFAGYAEVEGWIENQKNKQKVGKKTSKNILDFYTQTNITHTFKNNKEAEELCMGKEGVRGILVFEKIVEVKYKKGKTIKHKDAKKIFRGKPPYAQGLPYRYLSEKMVSALVKEIEERVQNTSELCKLFKE